MKETPKEMLKRRQRLRGFSKGLSKMEPADLAIVYAKDGCEWEHYLDKCFRDYVPNNCNHRPLRIHTEMLENLTLPLLTTKVECILKSKAQLIIITPEFLDFVQENRGKLIGQMFDPNRVLAMLCGVDAKDVEDVHRAELVTFSSWHTMPVLDQDQNFVLQLIHKTWEIIDASEESEVMLKPKFKLTPRKVKEGSNKVYALLQYAVTNDHEIKIYIKNNDGTATEIPAKKRNPFTVQFLIPENLLVTSHIISIQITCDGAPLGVRQLKCDSKMGELQHLLSSVRDPMAFLCQTLGLAVNMTKELDTLLANAFKKNLVDGMQVLDLTRDVYARKTEEEMPTLLHFAAQFGLRELCSLLLDCPGAKIACNIRNASDYCPSEIAEIAGYPDLAQMLENFMNLSVAKDIYSMISSVTEDTSSQKIYDSLYDYPSNIPLYDSPSFPIPVPQPEQEDDYLPMTGSTSSTASLDSHKMCFGLDLPENDYKVPPKIHVETPTTVATSLSCIVPGRHQGYTHSQIELLELLEDFKTNKVDLNEVEELFEQWKKRQSMQSFKEKEQQLASMREKYEQLQQNAPEKNKMAFSLIDKFISILPNKANKKTTVSKVKQLSSKKQENELDESHLRPISTLSTTSVISSISSSSSSDRLSTISSVSNYDSGAQSDSGDDSIRHTKENLELILQRRVSVDQFYAKKGSSGFHNDDRTIPVGMPPLPPVNSLTNKDTVPSKAPPKVPLKPPSISPNTSKPRPDYLTNIEERKPMPPPRPDRTSFGIFGHAEEKEYQNISPDYVSPDPDPALYQIPVTPARSIFEMPNKPGKKALMPMKKPGIETCIRKTPTPPAGRKGTPDYVNLSHEDIQKISQQYSKTQHHDYYNWSAPEKSQKLSPSERHFSSPDIFSTLSSSPKTGKLSSPSMRDRPLPEKPVSRTRDAFKP